MRSISVFALAALILALPLAFADAGPSPPAPTLIVHMVKNGQPDSTVSEIVYHCSAITDPTDSPVGKNNATMPCRVGTCMNDGDWFYKLNPCYDFPGGYFTFISGGSGISSQPVAFDRAYGKYEITIDPAMPSGIGDSGVARVRASSEGLMTLDFLQAFVLTIAIEGAVLYLFHRDRYHGMVIARNAIIASSITLPFVWFAFPLIQCGWGLQTAIAETFAVAIETVVYRYAFGKMSWREAAMTSAMCNWASFMIGLALP
jgi:hypothetical protein